MNADTNSETPPSPEVQKLARKFWKIGTEAFRDHKLHHKDWESVSAEQKRGFYAIAEYVINHAEEPSGKYNELLYAVARKFPNESRHETALRYILEKEADQNLSASVEVENTPP